VACSNFAFSSASAFSSAVTWSAFVFALFVATANAFSNDCFSVAAVVSNASFSSAKATFNFSFSSA
jgi:hypothetical protein